MNRRSFIRGLIGGAAAFVGLPCSFELKSGKAIAVSSGFDVVNRLVKEYVEEGKHRHLFEKPPIEVNAELWKELMCEPQA